MPMVLRVVLLVAGIGIGAVVVRHVTDALQGIPVARRVAASESGER